MAGAVGEDRCNRMMKAVTKALRRGIFAAVGLIHQRQRAPLLGSIAHPIAAAFVVWWLLDGARMLRNRVPIRWGGKEYVLAPRK